MAQSLSKIYIHLIFHIKSTSPEIRDEDLERVHGYIAEVINKTGCQTFLVGGISNHVHILLLLAKHECISHVVEEAKRNSSRWIKTIDGHYAQFEWQAGYGAFSVSQSVVDNTLKYIKNQKEHHRKHTFQEEYLNFLKSYGIEYDERYVFSER